MRSLKKGPFIDRSLLRSVEKINTELEKLLSGGQTPLIPSADAESLGSNSGIADKEASKLKNKTSPNNTEGLDLRSLKIPTKI